jgi:thiol:disulfide interchange protein
MVPQSAGASRRDHPEKRASVSGIRTRASRRRLIPNMTRYLPTTVLALLTLLLWVEPRPCAARQDGPVTVTVKPSKSNVAPGDQIAIAVIFDHEPKWHIHTNEPVLTPAMVQEHFTPFETSIDVKTGSAKVFPIQWPKVHTIPVDLVGKGKPEPYGVFEGRAIAFVPIQIPADAKPGTELPVELAIAYQACDDKTCMGLEDVAETVTLRVVELALAGSKPDPDFAAFDLSAFASGTNGSKAPIKAKPVKFDTFGWSFSIDTAGFGFALLLLVAALGGLLLNFTPCVLPVVPLKIMSLSQSAGNPARCFFLGLVMSLGVVAFWVGIGAAIAFISGFTAINSLFQTPWFSLGVGAFILVMAIGMLGAFAVRLPQIAYMVNPSHDTATGSFFFGIMTAVLSTPCTAPFMGSAAAWAATQTPLITLATFGAIGAGMALPYLVLSAFPVLLSRMPRTGPASELIKQVMGLLMIAVAIFFLGTGLDPLLRLPIDPPIRLYWWLVAAVAVAAMAWLVYRTFQITRRPRPRVIWTGFAVVFALTSIWVAKLLTDLGPIPWVGYTPDRLAARMGENKIVVLDFTAEWCVNCKALEVGVLHRAEVVKLLTGPDVVPMRVDLTGNNVPGKQKLKELEWVGIPLLVVYGPGVTEPIMYDTYTVDMVREAIARAAGRANAAVPVVPAAAAATNPAPSGADR